MNYQSISISWILGSSLVGMMLIHAEVAHAESRPCLNSPSIAGIDFNDDCKMLMLSFGSSSPNQEQFRLRMARQLTIAIAQYNSDFAVAHAPKTINGLLAMRYDSAPNQLVSTIVPYAWSPVSMGSSKNLARK